MPSPSPNGKNGRSVNGRFALGNVGGPGNPLAKRTGHIKRVLLDAVTDDDLRAIAKSLIEQAKGGNAKAAELILSRLLGKSTTEPLAGVADVELTEHEQAERLAEWKARLIRSMKDSQLGELPAKEENIESDTIRSIQFSPMALIENATA